MWFLTIIPLYFGFATILQSGLNRNASKTIGFIPMAIFNNSVGIIFAILIYSLFYQSLPESFRLKTDWEWRWWYIVPGILGFSIVAGIPYAFSKLGALKVIIGMVCAQVIGSLLWDLFLEGIPVTKMRLISAGLAILSMTISVMK